MHYKFIMKRSFCILTAFVVTSTGVMADIQAPPGSTYTSSRKLGRAVSNILYGLVEVPEQMVRKTEQYGSSAGWTYGMMDGSRRAFKRIGYQIHKW